jgi:hypothetical protein
MLRDCEVVAGALATVIPENQFWRWKDMWTNSLRNAVFTAVMVEYLSTRKLLSLADAASSIGSEYIPHISLKLCPIADSCQVMPEWSGRIALSVEDYLHSLINVINELVSRSSLMVL